MEITDTVNGQATTATEQAQDTTPQTNTEQTQTTSTEGAEQYLKLTQKDLDNLMAKTRGATEREIFKTLGVDSKDALPKVREAYTNTLSAEEKLNNDLQQWQTTANTYKSQAEESDQLLTAIEVITGKKRDEVKMVVGMAKGITSEETPFETAMQTVMGMMAQQQPAQQKPSGFGLLQPDQVKGVGLDEYKKMSGQEKIKLKQENPKLYEQFKKQLGF